MAEVCPKVGAERRRRGYAPLWFCSLQETSIGIIRTKQLARKFRSLIGLVDMKEWRALGNDSANAAGCYTMAFHSAERFIRGVFGDGD